MRSERVPGAQVVAISRDGLVWSSVAGFADAERKRPMRADTPVQIGSVTKVFTASLVADLVAQEHLNWSDTLGKLLPDLSLRPEIAGISLSELASHTSRLPKDPPNRVDIDGVWRAYTRAELHAALADPALELVEPDWNYSNFGFAILGHIVERSAGKPFEQVLRERILAPLDMESTSIALSPERAEALAVHYWPEDDPLRPRTRWMFGDIAGFGGITSTAADLSRFLAYQMNPRSSPNLLNADAVIAMRAVRFVFPDWRLGFGRPWIERRQADGTIVIEHGGEVDGHSAIIMFSPAQGVGVAATANLGQSGAEEVAKPIFARLLALARSRPKTREQAMGYYHSAQWGDAEAAFAGVAAQSPDDGDAWFRLGRARVEVKDWAGARTALQRAISLPEPSRNAFYYLAIIAANEGQATEAVGFLRRGLDAGLNRSDLSGPEFRALKSNASFADLITGR